MSIASGVLLLSAAAYGVAAAKAAAAVDYREVAAPLDGSGGDVEAEDEEGQQLRASGGDGRLLSARGSTSGEAVSADALLVPSLQERSS